MLLIYAYLTATIVIVHYYYYHIIKLNTHDIMHLLGFIKQRTNAGYLIAIFDVRVIPTASMFPILLMCSMW